jgi:rod shape-determining protein MreD
MRGLWPPIAALVVAAVLQVGISPHLAIYSVVPNLILLVVVTMALTEGPTAGCVLGFSGGLLLDLLGSGPIGAWALVFCAVGYLSGMLEANLFASGWVLPVTVVLVASLTAEASYATLLAALGTGGPFWSTLARVVVPGALYNTTLAVLVFPWLARFMRQEPSMTVVRRLL